MSTLFDRISQLQTPQTQADAQSQVTRVQQAATGQAGQPGRAATGIRQQTAAQQVQAGEQQLGLQEGIQAAELTGQREAQQQQAQLGQEQLATQQRMTEQQMGATGVLAREQVAAQAELAGMGREAQEEMVRQQIETNSLHQLTQLASQYNTKVNDIFANFQRSNEELDFRKDAAQLEQIAFQLAMADRAYLDNLTRVGQENRLHDEHAFQKEMTKVMLGDRMAEMMKQLGFQEELGQMNRDWAKELAQMGFSSQMDLAREAIRAANQRAMWEAGGTMVGIGAAEAVKRYDTD